MKKLVFVFGIFLSFKTMADWQICQNGNKKVADCEYKIEDGVLTVRGKTENGRTGTWNGQNSEPIAPWHEYKDEIVKIVVEDSIKSIGGRAFSDLPNVTEVELPEGTSVIWAAFQQCSSLKDISFLPSSLTTIAQYTFHKSGLENIVIPENITTIGENAFSWSHDLKSVLIGENVTSVGKNAFHGTSAYVYCQEGDGHGGKSCAELVKESGITGGKLKIYTIENGKIKVGSKVYDSLDDLPKYTLKRIYTIDEANAVAGNKNRVSIKYR